MPRPFLLRFIGGTYQHSILSAAELTKKLHFTAILFSNHEEKVFYKLFAFRVVRWLHGCGHPKELAGTFIDWDSYHQECSNPLLRAKLLLVALTELDVLPLHAASLKVRLLKCIVLASTVTHSNLRLS